MEKLFKNMSDNILVIMSDNRDIINDIDNCGYNTLAALINYNYCKKHNYGFKYFIPNNNGDLSLNNCFSPSKAPRYTSWNKLISTIKAIEDYKDYDYIVYIDTDCIFNNINLSISEYYKNLQVINSNEDSQCCILFLNDRPFEVYLPCAGYYILKNNDSSKQFIKQWYNLDSDRVQQHNTVHPYEQFALYEYFHELNKSEQILLIDDYMFVDFNKDQFLRHIGTHENWNRTPIFKTKILELLLDKDFTFFFEDLKNDIVKFDINEIINKL